jgi:hypothetical protein
MFSLLMTGYLPEKKNNILIFQGTFSGDSRQAAVILEGPCAIFIDVVPPFWNDM